MRGVLPIFLVGASMMACQRSGPTSAEPTPAFTMPASTSAVVSSSSAAQEPLAIGPDAAKFDLKGVVGAPAPPWELADWLDGKSRSIADYRGQVVLIRWFTQGCPYCSSTAPTLVSLDKELRGKGLAIVGAYHHKEKGPLEMADVHKLVSAFGFEFPVGVDRDWRTLKRWWLDAHEGWTSISFLIDRKGVIRYVHTGGEYGPGSADAAQVRRWIDNLLAEPAT